MPSHVAVPFDGVGHGVHEAPHVAMLVFDPQLAPHAWNPASHVNPQLVPSHVAVPFVGMAHATHEAPHEATLMFDAHALPHA
jgi:hypothetical protein